MVSNRIEVHLIAGALGAEIQGVDLSQPLDDVTFEHIHQALLDHCVIFFRGQDITPDQQHDFAMRWGKVHFHPHIKGLSERPEIF